MSLKERMKGNVKKPVVFIPLIFLLTYSAPAQLIYTIAGDGTAGSAGDGNQAILAQLNKPNGVALDDSGNVYIGDNVNNKVRRVDARTGIITTIAGTGTAGYSGDGGQATAAELYRPGNMAVNKQGNLYICDVFNQRIRMVNMSTGIITTIAGTGLGGYSGDGGPATKATFYYPQSLRVDTAGNIYIADVLNNVIRKITASTGSISTVVGNGNVGYTGDGGQATAATLNSPVDVSFDSVWNMYISDGSNDIRKVNATTGIITTVAGNGVEGYGGDGGPATAAAIDGPTGITLDKFGNIYIGDVDNSRIRKVNGVTGIITTVIGNGTEGYAGDSGLATACEIYYPGYSTMDATGDFYFADSYNNRIRKVVGIVGIQGVTNEPVNVSVYPVPASAVLNVNIQSVGMSGVTLTLYNEIGQSVMQKKMSEHTNEYALNVEDLSNGVYFMKVERQDGQFAVRKVEILK